jgi:Leucine-rich repeat (LRR) protein
MNLFLLSLVAVAFSFSAQAQTLLITGFNASSATICAGNITTFTATIGNVSGGYTYTLTNGSSPFSGSANTPAFSQTLTASGTGAQTFTLTVSNNGTSTSATAVLTVGSHPDYQPLVDLYNSTNGSGWSLRIGWLNGCNPCTGNNGRPWYGLTCTSGRVTRLNLGFNQLIGTLPASLGSLNSLQQLYLNDNQLTGEIPGSLSTLINIQQLSFTNNQLSGAFPASLSILCGGGRSVNMSNNPGLPGGGDFAKFCSTIPCSETFLAATLTAVANQSTICVGNVVSLTALGIGNIPGVNFLWSAPSETILGYQATPSGALAILTTSGPKTFTVLASESSSCIKIATVTVIGLNRPTPTLTPSTTSACDQTSLTLTASGGILGGPFSYTFVNNRGVLGTPGLNNTFVANAPGSYSVIVGNAAGCTAIANAKANLGIHPDYQPLVDFYISTYGRFWRNNNGWLVGCDPCTGNNGSPWYGITCLNSRVTQINLRSNLLQDYIPASISALTHLQRLDLYLNSLRGSIPASMSSLSDLQYLSVAANKLSGTIPISLSEFPRLEYLDLSDNQLTGNILPTLGKISTLQCLYLDKNQLTGPIPSSLGSLKNLQRLSLSINQLSGNIPKSLGSLTKLERLFLYRNQLTGSIPDSLGLLHAIQTIVLYDNQLSGTIPVSFSGLAEISYLDLSNNKLTGSIPSSFGSLTNVQELSLYRNQLSGEIPASLSNITKLQRLSLSRNLLTGCIPTSLSMLCSRQFIDLTNNPNLPLNGDFAAFCANGTGSDAYLATASATPVRSNLSEVVRLSASSSPGISYTWTAPAGTVLSNPTTNSTVSATMTSPGLQIFTVVSNGGTCVPPMTVSVVANAPCGSPGSTTGIGQPLTITGVRVIDCTNGSFQILTRGGTGQPINFAGIVGLRNTDPYNCLRTVDGADLVRAINTPTSDVGPFNLQAVQVGGGLTNTFSFDLKGYCTTTTNPPSTTTSPPSSTTTTPPSSTPTECGSPTSTLGQSLSITGVTDVRCLTGSFRILTTGGNGQPINFAGIVGLSNEFPYNCVRTVDSPDLVQAINNPASDASPFMLRGVQVGGATSPAFAFDFKQHCARLARIASPEFPDNLTVTVLGNPTLGENVAVEVRGAAGEWLQLQLLNEQGMLLRDTTVQKAVAIERQTIKLDRSVGVYFLQVTTPTKTKTVKIVRQ